jgi:AcrR family transcriptional regulator
MTADPTAGTNAPLRADARRNREQIVAAAREIFAADGPDVPMEEIARAAGVGVGTLYRRFGDRDALIHAVTVDSGQRVLAEGRTAIEEEPTAWGALVRLFGQSVELQPSLRLAMLSPRAAKLLRSDPELGRLKEELFAMFGSLVIGAQAEGTLRDDVSVGDITMLFASLLRQSLPHSAEISERAILRSVGIMLDGLRARPSDPLPGRPLTIEDLTG